MHKPVKYVLLCNTINAYHNNKTSSTFCLIAICSYVSYQQVYICELNEKRFMDTYYNYFNTVYPFSAVKNQAYSSSVYVVMVCKSGMSNWSVLVENT